MYRSSSEKDFIRDLVDLPLLERLHSIRGIPLNYFGLPGSDLEDVKSWKHLLGQVAAVERSSRNLRAMDETVSMEMPDLRFTPHFGEIDLVILRDRGKRWKRGGEAYQPWVRISRPNSGHLGWYFDVVNLDYFGPFLPEGGELARQRADAIRKLFDIERLDSWGRWVLLVTVEAQLVTQKLGTQLVSYLRGVQNDSSQIAASIIEFLSQPATNVREGVTAARLIHAVSASLVARSASQANLSAIPRGTILYRGSGGQPMVHLAYEFEPLGTPLPPPSPLLQLLKGPLLTTHNDTPELTLLDEQVPSLTQDDVRTAVDFLEKVEVERLVAQLS